MRALRLALAALCAALLVALMGVTVVDVAGRYLLDAPLDGANDMTQLLLAAIVFTGLPAVCLDDGHVTVDLLTSRWRGGLDAARLALARLAVALVLLVVAWRLWVHGERLLGYGERSLYLGVPTGPVAIGAGVLCALAALVALWLLVSRMPEGGARPAASNDPGAQAGQARAGRG